MSHTTIELGKQTIAKLQDLIRVNTDSADGFEKVAELTEEPQLESLFRDLSKERRGFAEELKRFVEVTDQSADDDGSFMAKIHRWWIDIRAKLMNKDPYDILAEAERGEDSVKRVYEDVLPEIAGSPVNDLLLKQYAQVKRGHDRVRDLRDERNPAKK